jgi:hypothetical protein
VTTLTGNHSTIFCRFVGVRASAMAVLLAFSPAGCGGSNPQPEQATSETQPSEKAPPPAFDVTMSEMPDETEETPDPSSAATKEVPKTSEPEKTVRRPQPTFSNDQEIATTIGESGAVMKIGTAAMLRIPEGALRDGKNVRFSLSASGPSKTAPPPIGQSFALEPKLRSAGAAFEITFSIPEGANAVELVIMAAPGKSEYRKLSPKRVDAKKKQALFELEELPGGDVYLTTATTGK